MPQAHSRPGADFARPTTRTSGFDVAVVVVGHGSRDAIANAQVEALVDAYRRRRPELDVSHGYVELATPLLAPAIAAARERASRVVLLPLFFFGAGHVKSDLPLAAFAARAAHPEVELMVAGPLGVHPLLCEALFERASCSTFGAMEPETARRTTVLVVGRGSSDPDANGDFCKLVRLFG